MKIKCICDRKEEFLFNGELAVKLSFHNSEPEGARLIAPLSFKLHVKPDFAGEYTVGNEYEITI